MAQYIIGDVQGCYDSLMALLDEISYNEKKDELVFAGDAINRGPKSLDTLRFIAQSNNCKMVLGNHDLHLLAVDYGYRKLEKLDTLQDILQAPDSLNLINYIKQCNFAIVDKQKKNIIVHAGIPPNMSFNTFVEKLEKLESDFHRDSRSVLCRDDDMLNALTRIRFCRKDGRADYNYKGNVADGKACGLLPWFDFLHDSFYDYTIFFGHWAALNACTQQEKIIGLDTGCVWGAYLSAYCVQENKIYSVKAVENGL